MLLSTIYSHLAYGELRQLPVSDKDNGTIFVATYPEVISYINLALVDLHTRFNILEKSFILRQYDHITDYTISYDFALTNPADPGETYRYIRDTENDLFDDDVLKITKIVDEDGVSVPLNDENNSYSLFTPSHDILEIPTPQEANELGVIYRAYPAEIPLDDVAPGSYIVDIGRNFLAPILSFVGHRAHISLPKGDGAIASASFNRYEALCKHIKDHGTTTSDRTTNSKLTDRGFA